MLLSVRTVVSSLKFIFSVAIFRCLLFARSKFIRCLMGQFEMKYPSEASCAVSEVSLPLQDYFRNVEEESSAALRKEVFRFFIFLPGV